MLGMLGFVQLLPERLGGAEVDACDKKEWIPLHLESQGRRSLADAYGPWAMAQTWMQGCMSIRLRYISQHTTDTGNSENRDRAIRAIVGLLLKNGADTSTFNYNSNAIPTIATIGCPRRSGIIHCDSGKP
jgi:hypothetical protein